MELSKKLHTPGPLAGLVRNYKSDSDSEFDECSPRRFVHSCHGQLLFHVATIQFVTFLGPIDVCKQRSSIALHRRTEFEILPSSPMVSEPKALSLTRS